MTADVFDLKQAVQQDGSKLNGLQVCMTPLLGEPFQFARVSFGDELTLHLGNLRSARSPKLKLQYGGYILGVRASSWLIKTNGSRIVTSADDVIDWKAEGLGKELTNIELEQASFIDPGSRVISAIPFLLKPHNSIGLQIQFSDGSTFLIFPRDLPVEDDGPEDGLPEIADWEVTMPEGHLTVGPNLVWSYQPRTSIVMPVEKAVKKKSKQSVLVTNTVNKPKK